MNISPSHLDALQALGYTEEEARFLYIVAAHSGYFVARQFLGFTGSHWGKRTTTFWNKLQGQKHARRECHPMSGVIYHLFSRRLYRRIEKENLRNRRAHELDFIRRRLAMLDFVLTNQGYQYLETEADKVRFFCGRLDVEKHFLPAKLYLGKPGSRPTVRYFVDKLPMFLAHSSPVVTFTYVQEGESSFSALIQHLQDYIPLFKQLSQFRFLYVSRAAFEFEKASEIFRSLVKIPLESDIGSELVRYFRVRKAWDEKQYAAVTEADLIFRNQARSRFCGDRFEGFYRGWKAGRISEESIRHQFPVNSCERSIAFDAFLLKKIGITSWTQMGTGDAGRNYMGLLLIRHDRHLPMAQADRAGTFTRRRRARATVEKTQNRAGATPLSRLSAAQVDGGVAPALAAQVNRAACFFHGLGEKHENT